MACQRVLLPDYMTAAMGRRHYTRTRISLAGLTPAVSAHIGSQTLACPVQVLNNYWRATAAKPHPDPKMNERHVMNAFGHNAIIVSEALDAVLEAEAASEVASPALLSTLCTAATTYFWCVFPSFDARHNLDAQPHVWLGVHM